MNTLKSVNGKLAKHDILLIISYFILVTSSKKFNYLEVTNDFLIKFLQINQFI